MKYTAKYYKQIHGIILKGNEPLDIIQPDKHKLLRVVFYIVCVLTMVYVLTGCASAETIEGHTTEQWAKAIYISEGGKNTKHPYGVLAKYKHTSPKQACINTVSHKYRLWVKSGQHGSFTTFLGHSYAPVGCNNDLGTNRFWIKNVSYWIERV